MPIGRAGLIAGLTAWAPSFCLGNALPISLEASGAVPLLGAVDLVEHAPVGVDEHGQRQAVAPSMFSSSSLLSMKWLIVALDPFRKAFAASG